MFCDFHGTLLTADVTDISNYFVNFFGAVQFVQEERGVLGFVLHLAHEVQVHAAVVAPHIVGHDVTLFIKIQTLGKGLVYDFVT